MLLKCCSQYASKSGKLSSGRRTGKGQFSFHSQRKAMPKNVQPMKQKYQTITLISHASKIMLNSTWTMNFQMFKLDLEKAEEPEIKLPASAESSNKQEFQKKHLLLLYWLYQSLWLCGSQQTRKFWKRWPDHLTCLLRNLYAGQEATGRTRFGSTNWFQIGKGVCQGCILSSWLFNLYAE